MLLLLQYVQLQHIVQALSLPPLIADSVRLCSSLSLLSAILDYMKYGLSVISKHTVLIHQELTA